MSYVIHQFHLSDAARDHLNSVGWDGDFGDFPEIRIQRDVKFMGGSKNYAPWMEDHYESVARVTGAETVEDVFHVGNGYGPAGTCIQKFTRMHSVSVGDIIVNEKCGTAWMCESEGWSNIDFGRMF
jgi:hypothetical protein